LVVVRQLGATTVIHVRIERASRHAVRIVVPADRALAVDDEVAIRIRRDRVYVFDERTGMAVTLR